LHEPFQSDKTAAAAATRTSKPWDRQHDDKTTGEKTRPSSSSSGHETRPKTRFEFEELQHFGEPCGVSGVCGERRVVVIGVCSCA